MSVNGNYPTSPPPSGQLAPPPSAPGPNPEDLWHLSSGGQVNGPYMASDIRTWLSTGHVSWDTQTCRVGDTAWRPLGSVEEFSPTRRGKCPYCGGPLVWISRRTPTANALVIIGICIFWTIIGFVPFFIGLAMPRELIGQCTLCKHITR